MMRKFRRSNKSNDQTAAPVLQRNPASIQPPKKVITATRAFQPRAGQNSCLTFKAGDFFHVIANEDDPEWLEVEGLGGARGFVPARHFEEVGKVDNRQRGSSKDNHSSYDTHDSGYSEQGNNTSNPRGSVGGSEAAEAARKKSMSSTRGKAGVLIFGVVSYDFDAERADELAAKAGEKIIIIAQSNPEWFVAKPIERLGGPGLIPVAFVSVRYTHDGTEVQDPMEAVKAAGVPRVEEWKSRAAWYKNNSVPLGQLAASVNSQGSQQSLQDGMSRMSVNTGASRQSHDTYRDQYSQQRQSRFSQMSSHSKQGLITPSSGHVSGFSRDPDTGDYWYRVEVNTDDGRAWGLRRFYKEFYALQVHLFEWFPDAAGQGPSNSRRILPTLPGPLPEATLDLTKQRLPYMDLYVRQLLSLPYPNITKSHPCSLFFSPREEDEEIEPFDVHAQQRESSVSQQSYQTGMYAHSNNPSFSSTNGPSYQESQQRRPPQHQFQQSHRPESPYSENGNDHHRSPSELRVPNGSNGPSNNLPYNMQRTDNDMAGRSNTSLSSSQPQSHQQYPQQQQQPTPSNPSQIVKVKVFLGANCILLRLPFTFTYDDLSGKVRERWLLEPDVDKENMEAVDLIISYKDERAGQWYKIAGEGDLEVARQRCEKLTVRVQAPGEMER